jgi:hypothetical protein
MDPSSSWHEQIELRAYQFWEERGRRWGTPDADWFKAEAELMNMSQEGTLSKVAREVGTALGTVAVFLGDINPTRREIA